MEIEPIAHIVNDYKEKFGVPRQSGKAPSLLSDIIFEDKYRVREALRGLEGFSHVWLIFGFSLNDKKEFSPTVRPPRLGGNTRLGVFATRSPFRPNNLGLSCVKIEKIGEDCTITVSGADLVNGTPVYDIKPYIPYADCVPDALAGFSSSNSDYTVEVVFPEELQKILPPEKNAALIESLREDPRPAYKKGEKRVYTMSYAGFEVEFEAEEKKITVINIKKR